MGAGAVLAIVASAIFVASTGVTAALTTDSVASAGDAETVAVSAALAATLVAAIADTAIVAPKREGTANKGFQNFLDIIAFTLTP